MYCRAPFQSLLLCFLILSLVGCNQSPQQTPHEQAKESRKEAAKKLEERRNQVFMEFEKKYNADATWQDSLKRNPVWTMDVQDRLIPADGRPILSTGSLHDVKRKGGEYMLYFKRGHFRRFLGSYVLGGVDVDFILKCSLPEDKRTESKDIGEQITARAIRKFHDEYAFAAKIHTVERIGRLIATAIGDENAEIQVDDSPHFLAGGECVAVKYIGE